jgi:hypothetical protein
MTVRVVQYLIAVLMGVFFALAVAYPGSFLVENLTAAVIPAGGAILAVIDTVQRRKWRQAENEALKHVEAEREKRRARRDLELKERALGLPTAIAPLVSGGPVPFPDVPGWHICRGKAYRAVAYCPVHGTSVTTVKGADVPPLDQLTEMSAQYQLPLAPAVSMAQFAERLKAIQRAVQLTFPDGGPFLAEEEPEYVPAGQAELSAMLLEYMTVQVTEANRSLWTSQRKRYWHMSPEWLDEVERAYPGVMQSRRVLGYPVWTGQEYGTPELVPS